MCMHFLSRNNMKDTIGLRLFFHYLAQSQKVFYRACCKHHSYTTSTKQMVHTLHPWEWEAGANPS